MPNYQQQQQVVQQELAPRPQYQQQAQQRQQQEHQRQQQEQQEQQEREQRFADPKLRVGMARIDRTLELIKLTRQYLDRTETYLKGDPPTEDKKIRRVESMLLSWILLSDDVSYVTGPAGYDPQPNFELCEKCGEYLISNS